MNKTCFVIMPKSHADGYANGHFNRVFQYIIGPACRNAGFTTLRADAPTSDDHLDMLKTIIDSDMVMCDLSGNNTHGVYGFAIREALKLPVVLIRDTKTKVVDISEFEYDESLRIDTVEQEIETLAKALTDSLANKGDNTTLKRLSIGVSAPAPQMEAPLELIEEAPKKPALPLISPVPDYVGDPLTQEEIDALKVGDAVFHINYGRADIKVIRKDKLTTLQFANDTKLLVLTASGIFRKVNK